MRLNKLNELIHNSSTQNNLKFARVTIYFKEIKDLENEQYEEIPNSNFILSREVYKNGSSKYFLNSKEILFDNLCVILNKKGIDLKHNRFLILQGEVEQISMMKPKATNAGEVGLLEFLEDIIGTNRFVNLIERVSKDIDELSEIKTQKANRVKITKNELDQLEDVKNSSTEYYKKEKELHIFGHLDFLIKRHIINKQILSNEEKTTALNQNLEEINVKIQSKLDENTTFIEEHKKIRKEQEVIKLKKTELVKKTEEFEEIDKVKRADVDNYSKQIEKAKTALVKFNKNLNSQNENIQTAQKELPLKEKELKTLLDVKKQLDNYINEKEQEIFDKSEKLQIRKLNLQKEMSPADDKINNNKFQIEQNKSTIDLISQKFEKISSELKRNTELNNEISKNLAEKNNSLSMTESGIKKAEQALKEMKKNLEDQIKKVENKYLQSQGLISKISEIKASVHDKSQKNIILEALLKAQSEGKLSGIYGRLGDLGSIDTQYDVAITTSCSNLDAIIVETVEHAQKCLDFLKKNNIGRASFIILEKVSWVEQKMKENFKSPNNCERLFDLVKIKNQRLAIAFYFALRDTLVCTDLKTATSIAYGNTRHRIVTINGELIEVSGTMSGGGKPKRGGMSNKEAQDVNYSTENISKMNLELENIQKEYEAIKIEKNGAEQKVQELQGKLQEMQIFKNRTEIESNNLQRQLNENNKSLAQAEQDYNKYNKDIEKTKTLEENNSKLEKLNEDLLKDTSQKREELAQVEIEIGKVGGEEFNRKKEDLKNHKRRIDQLDKDINSYRHTIDNAPQILEKIKEEIELKDKIIIEYEKNIEEIKKELENLEQKALEVYGEIENYNQESINLEKKFTEKNKALDELKVIIRKMKDDQEKIRNEIADIGIEIKKAEKNEKLITEDLLKNKKSFKKLLDEFGFIDDFEKEIQNIQKTGLEAMDVDEDDFNNNKNNFSDDLNEEDEEVDYKRNKSRKVTNNYQKFINAKYIEHDFKFEELDSLSKSNVIIFSIIIIN